MPQHDSNVLPVQGTGMQLHAQGIQEYEGIVLPVQGWGMREHVQGMREHDSIPLPVQGRGMQPAACTGHPIAQRKCGAFTGQVHARGNR